MVAGLMVGEMGGMPPFWMIYFGVDDADKAAADIKAAGGTVHRSRRTSPAPAASPWSAIPGRGSATCRRSRWRAAGGGERLRPEEGWARQLERADDERPGSGLPLLCRRLRLAEVEAVDMGEMGTYQVFTHDGADIGGMMGLGNSPAPAWLPYFGTSGVTAAMGGSRRPAARWRTGRWKSPAAPSSPSPRTRRGPGSRWSGRRR